MNSREEDFHGMGPGERSAWSNGYHAGLRQGRRECERELLDLEKEIERLQALISLSVS